jgi:hypothetical protein
MTIVVRRGFLIVSRIVVRKGVSVCGCGSSTQYVGFLHNCQWDKISYLISCSDAMGGGPDLGVVRFEVLSAVTMAILLNGM